jgi:hypothetical protein
MLMKAYSETLVYLKEMRKEAKFKMYPERLH